MKKKSSIIIILLAVVIGAIHIKSQVLTEAEKAEATKKTKVRIIKDREYVLDLHKSDLIKYKSQYEEDSSNMNALSLVTEKYWLIAKAYKDLDKRLERQPSTELIERNMQKSLQYLEELDAKMSAGWDDPEFRENNENIVKQLIKFSIHLSNDEKLKQEWTQVWLNRNLEKWNRGERTYAVAHWIRGMYSGQTQIDPKTGRQATIPEILYWTEKMNEIGKPKGYSQGQPW